MSKFDEPDHYRQDQLLQIDTKPPKTSWMETPVDLRKGTYIYPGKAKNLEVVDLPNPREWAVEDDRLEAFPRIGKRIVLEGMADRLTKYRSFKLFMDICVRCGACADKCHFFIGSGDPKNMPVLRAELLRSIYRKDFTAMGKIFGKHGRGPATDRRRHQGVVLLLLPVHRVPALLGLLPLRHRHGRDHHDGPGAPRPAWSVRELGHRAGGELLPVREPPGHPAPRPGGHPGVHGRRHRRGHRDQGGSPHQQEGRRDPLRHPIRGLRGRSRHLHLHGVHAALPRAGDRLHLEHLRIRRRELRAVHLPRDDEAAQRQDLRRGQAPGGEVDPGR